MPNTKIVKISFICQRAGAEIWEGLFSSLDSKAVVGQEAISTQNGQDLASGDTVRLVVFLSQDISKQQLAGIVELGESLCAEKVTILQESLADEDWVTKSQQGLKPIRLGQLTIMSAEDHTAIGLGQIAIKIGAANAFGTGHHGTTFGCLNMLQAIAKRTRKPLARHMKMADVGAGTALLAFASAKLFKPKTPVFASDIDHRSIPTAKKNAKINRLQKNVRIFQSADVSHSKYRNNTGFDLVCANILSGLLIDMAPRLSQIIKPKGTLILAGLLSAHALSVVRAYELLGYRRLQQQNVDDWSILTLKRIRPCRSRIRQRGYQRFHSPKDNNWMHS